MKNIVRRFFLGLSVVVVIPAYAYCEWTPLVTSDTFTGIRTDVETVVAAIISILVIVAGLGMILRAIK